MPLASYHDFFTASATVAGALIGLLFVAISVTTGKISGPHASAEHQATAGAAFTALVNTLVFALVALLPAGSLGVASACLAASGLASTFGLGFMLYRRAHREPIRRFSQIMLLVPPLALYGLQLANGIALAHKPGDAGRIGSQAGLAIVFFVYAIARAWQLVGARDPGVMLSLTGLARSLADRNLLPDDDPGPQTSPAPPQAPASPQAPAPPEPRG